MACGVLGGAVGQFAAREMFPNASDNSAILIRAVGAAVAAGVVGGIGFGLITLFTRGQNEPATPFDKPLGR
jgi:hypothetical protein